ncbi:unnamed protein product [Closterium sp. NIES-54]
MPRRGGINRRDGTGAMRTTMKTKTTVTMMMMMMAIPIGITRMETTTPHVAEQCKKLWQFVRDKRREHGIETMWIVNADQTPLWLEMPATTTVDQTGVRSVPIRSAGYQKERVTVMLACTADGMKLKPWLFFKRKTAPKGVFLPGLWARLTLPLLFFRSRASGAWRFSSCPAPGWRVTSFLPVARPVARDGALPVVRPVARDGALPVVRPVARDGALPVVRSVARDGALPVVRPVACDGALNCPLRAPWCATVP